MHLKVFVKLKKTLKTLSSGQKNPKKPKETQKTQKNPKKPKKTQKNPLGWVFLKKPGFFPTLIRLVTSYSHIESIDLIRFFRPSKNTFLVT